MDDSDGKQIIYLVDVASLKEEEITEGEFVTEVEPIIESDFQEPTVIEEKRKYKCKLCDKQFNHKSTLSRHKHTIHNPHAPVFTCAHCNRQYKTKTSLIRHLQRIQSKTARKSSLVVKCALCEHTASKSEILLHYETIHEVAIEKEIINFANVDEFYAWKTQTETESIARYVKIRKDRMIRDGRTEAFYRCHRDGIYKPRGKKLRNLKKIGSNKINGHCPAKMQVWIYKNQEVSVMFVKTHIGHEMELCRLTLSKEERNSIAKQLALQVPFETILDEVKDGLVVGDNIKRVNLLTRKDLYNIESSYSLTNVTFRNCVGINIENWIKEMIEEHLNSFIRFYKPQGRTIDGYPLLDANDFQLVIMNETQMEILRSGGNDCICIDTISLVNDFVLITVLVLDERDQGFPCAFLVTNNNEAHILEQFFETIKESCSCSFKPRIFMSSLDDCYYRAWNAVMPAPAPAFRIYSPWVIDVAWRNNLDKIAGPVKQNDYYNKLVALMEEKNVQKFEQDLYSLYKEMKLDPDATEFAEFFEEYKIKASSWAHCFRTHLGLNVNDQLDQIEKTLKLIHSCAEKKIFNLEKFIFNLMGTIKENLFDCLISVSNEYHENMKIEIIDKHAIAEELPRNAVSKKNKYWNVSSPSSEKIFRVKPVNMECNCGHSCIECMACAHAYICNCVDSSIKWNMCEHIHLVCLKVKTSGYTFKSHPVKTEIQIQNFVDGIDETGNQHNMIISVPESAYQYMTVPTGEENNILLTFETDSNDGHSELILNYTEDDIDSSVDERRSLLAEKCQNILNRISSVSQIAAFEQAMANLETEVTFIE